MRYRPRPSSRTMFWRSVGSLVHSSRSNPTPSSVTSSTSARSSIEARTSHRLGVVALVTVQDGVREGLGECHRHVQATGTRGQGALGATLARPRRRCARCIATSLGNAHVDREAQRAEREVGRGAGRDVVGHRKTNACPGARVTGIGRPGAPPPGGARGAGGGPSATSSGGAGSAGARCRDVEQRVQLGQLEQRRRSSFRFASRSSPLCSRIFLESETRTPSPELSM